MSTVEKTDSAATYVVPAISAARRSGVDTVEALRAWFPEIFVSENEVDLLKLVGLPAGEIPACHIVKTIN